ncbi:MAG: response regulator [Desulfobacterales bacterium]|nr:response regulator [Desulfobacterales bacterium]
MKRILIAEDDRVLRKRIVKAILRIGSAVTVQEAADTKEAIDYLGKQSVDLVITDIRMPKGSGLMVLAYLNAFLPDVPCFVITAYGTSRLKDKMPPDLLRFYDKPFEVGDFAVAVIAATSRQRGAAPCLGIQLPNFINLAAADGVTATITVTHAEHGSCKLFLKEGELIDALSGFERGEAVAVAALAWEKPEYSIELEIPADCERTIKTPLHNLLRISCDCFDEQLGTSGP